jgi:hypothetical protein
MPGTDRSVIATDSNSKLSCNPDIVCIHTIVGYAPASAAHFSTSAGGKIYQHRDTSKRSSANLNGNGHIISIENEDHGAAYGTWSGSNVPYFTEAQIVANAQICAWAHVTHGIPLVLCPNSVPGSRGIAYHRQGIDGNFGSFAYGGRVAGGELWSGSFGKVCPGDKRISQIPRIIEVARQIVGGEDLDARQNTLLEELHQTVISGSYEGFHDGKSAKINKDFRTIINEIVSTLQGQVDALSTKVELISAKLDTVTTPDIDEAALAAALVALGVGEGLTVEEVQTAVRTVIREQWNK